MYHIIDFVQKLLRKQLLYLFWCILSLISCANDCESSGDFAGNCIREWDVWRPSFCPLFFINFAQVTAGVGVFLRSFYQL